MGWKASLIIVQRPEPVVSEEELLRRLGFPNYKLAGETTLEECIQPGDSSFNIGYYNGCLVLADDNQLTEALEMGSTPEQVVGWEGVLSTLYPESEILTVACHSGVNYHLYSLVKGGRKLRYKKVVWGEPIVEYGERLAEEEVVYGYSKVLDGQRLFRSSYKQDKVYNMTEDQFKEDFTFGVAKRLLGVELSKEEDEELMFSTPFRKYVAEKGKSAKPTTPKAVAVQSAEKEEEKKSWWRRLFGG